ncbi:MAG: hypothetical protein PEPC_01648 [Peptostreptococcus russellii]
MILKQIKFYPVLILSIIAIGCKDNLETSQNKLVSIDVKSYVASNDLISIKNEIERIDYIPLELTDDNKSMIGQIMDVALTDNFIFILSDQTCGVLQFDIKGNFIRQVAKYGQGPGELIFPISMFSVEEENKLYITGAYQTTVYNFNGTFEEAFGRRGRMSFYSYPIGEGRVVETSSDGIPFGSEGHFGIGIFSNMGKGDTIYMKNDFSNEKIFSSNESGFKLTRCVLSDPGVLFSTMTSDTIYRLNKDTIIPAFCWQRNLNEESLKNAYSLLNFIPTNTELFLYDIIEFPKSVCFRYVYNEKSYIMLYDKQSGKISSTSTPYKMNDIANVDFWMTMWGINNDIDDGLPIAPLHWYKNKKLSIQCTSASTIDYLREQGELKTAPNIIKKMNGEDNPLVIIYHLK